MALMKSAVVAILLSIVALGFGAEETGSVKGRVDFAGAPPVMEQMKIAGDDVCERFNKQKPIRRQDVQVNPGNTLKNVVVWIEKGGPDYFYKNTGKSSKPVKLIQQRCEFEPHVVAIQTGQKLIVENVDPTIHNINAFPKENDRLNKAMIPGGEPVAFTFPNPEVAINVKSDIHPWMEAWVAVFDHPGFRVTGDEGTFEINDLPQGEYTIAAWHEKFGKITVPLLVQGHKISNIVFNFTAHGSKGGMQVDSQGNATTGTLED